MNENEVSTVADMFAVMALLAIPVVVLLIIRFLNTRDTTKPGEGPLLSTSRTLVVPRASRAGPVQVTVV